MDTKPTSEAPWQAGLRGARANLLPAVVLQLLALALVIGYYHLPQVHAALARLSQFRESAGPLFGIVSTGLCGGIIPFLYMRAEASAQGFSPRYTVGQGLGVTAFWAYKGLEIGIWYHLQAVMLGSGHEVSTIALKMILDQFVYCPIVAVPLTAVVYQLVDTNGDWSGFTRDVRQGGWYGRKVLPVLVSNLGVWLPAVAVIYAMPTPLQLPLQNLVLCFFTLIVANQTRSLPVTSP